MPYPPGGSSDIIARAISKPLSEALKQTVIIENKPGANGNTGTDFVAKSAPDGHTLLLCDVGALAITAVGLHQAALRPVEGPARRDHAGLFAAPAGGAPVGAGQQPDRTGGAVAQAAAELRRHRHRQRAARGRRGRSSAATGAKWTYIPYKGGSQAIGDTVAGQTQVLMNGMLATLPFVESGKLKVIGVSKAKRAPLLANVPTIAEQGVKGFESGTWQGVLVPAGTPTAVVDRLECRTHHHHPLARGARAAGVARRRGLYDDAGRVHAVLRA